MMRLLPLLLLVGCASDPVDLEIQLDTTACTGAIARLETYVLRQRDGALCALVSANSNGGTGEALLKTGKLEQGEQVLLLALAFGPLPATCDGGSCATCGDNSCDSPAETCQSCPDDCGACTQPSAADKICYADTACPTGTACLVMGPADTQGMCLAPCDKPGEPCNSESGTTATCVAGGASSTGTNQNFCLYTCEGGSCPGLLVCPGGGVCLPPLPTCGDQTCDSSQGETCNSCPRDCSCQRYTYCPTCVGLGQLKLGGKQAQSLTVELTPADACRIPAAMLNALELPAPILPPPDC